MTSWPRRPRLSFSSSSADTRSSVARRQRSLGDLVLSWASSASASVRWSSHPHPPNHGTRCHEDSDSLSVLTRPLPHPVLQCEGFRGSSPVLPVSGPSDVEPLQARPKPYARRHRACHRQNSRFPGLPSASSNVAHTTARLPRACIVFVIEVVHFRVSIVVLFVCRTEAPLPTTQDFLWGPQVLLRDVEGLLFVFFSFIFLCSSPRHTVNHLATGAGAASVPPAPPCVPLRRLVASKSKGVPVLLVPRWRRSRPPILLATRHPSQKTSTNMDADTYSGRGFSITKMAHTRRSKV